MISVCMASYNGAIFIKQQAVSILNQLGLEDELIISDDGSKDNTLEILASLNDSRIKIYHHSAPHGVVSNFENAIKHASGDYIFLSDHHGSEPALHCLHTGCFSESYSRRHQFLPVRKPWNLLRHRSAAYTAVKDRL